jgi:peptide/nickel transport system substrate-binding protein
MTGASAALLAACGGSSDDNGSDSEPQGGQFTGALGEPKQGGKFGDYFSNMSNYNVIANYHDGYRVSGVTVYDRPITARLDKRGYVLEAAESVEVAEPTKIVVKLRPGMVYQNKAPVNGRKVLASDIAATQMYVKTLSNAYDSAFQRNTLDHIEATDDTTVVYTLNKPAAYIFSGTYLAHPSSQPIIPKEMLEVLDTTPAVGSGPFELTDHTFSTKYSFKRFENYRLASDKKPYFDQREMVSLVDAVAQEAAFRSEQIHAWTPPGSIVDRLMGELDKGKFANLAYLSVGQSTFNGMMNAQLGGARPWHDVRVREAFYRATDRDQLIDLSTRGKAVVPAGPLPAALEAYQVTSGDTEKFFKTDISAAKQLLQAANYDNGKEWEVICSTTNAVNAQWAEIWQQQLSQIGVKVRIVAMPLSEILPKKMQPGNFDLWIGGNPGGDTPYRSLRSHHSNTGDQFNNTGLFNKDLDALIERSETATDRDENIKLVKEAQMEALKQYSMTYNMLTQQTFMFYNAKLQNFEVDPLTGQNYQTNAWFA